MSVVFGIASGIMSIAGGIAQKKAYENEADATRQQGQLALAEAQRNAITKAKENNALLKKNALAYMKAGVSLAGSPFLSLTEQKKENTKEEQSYLDSGYAYMQLQYTKAQSLENQGRAAMISGIAQGSATIGTSLAAAGA